MLTVENVETSGWRAAIRGMRNPMNSWDQSDSKVVQYSGNFDSELHYGEGAYTCVEGFCIGEKDHDLMRRLVASGPDHGKFMRMITITMDITAPEYWYPQFDAYRVGVTRNSCSKMHKLTEKPFTPDMFSIEHLYEPLTFEGSQFAALLKELNYWRDQYLATSDPEERDIYWWQILTHLPMSYNQRSTVCLNYQVARTMYQARKNHRLGEWHQLLAEFEKLPCSDLITMEV